MKKAITTAILATLLASTAVEAFAQDAPRGRAGERRDHSQGSPERAERSSPAPEAREAPAPPPQQRSPEPHRAGRAGIIDRDAPRYAPQAQPAPQPPPAPQARPAPRPGDNDRHGGGRDWNDRNRGGDDRNRRRNDNGWNDDRRHNDSGWNDNRRWDDDRRGGGYNRPNYNRPNYDRRYYPPVYRTPHRYNVAPYRRPPGWYSFSWSFGDVLPHAWYGPNYRINDWWNYDLPIPPIGYDWVRVGDDALLIDEFTGRVVQVVYDLFW